jgi:hypothetical protein
MRIRRGRCSVRILVYWRLGSSGGSLQSIFRRSSSTVDGNICPDVVPMLLVWGSNTLNSSAGILETILLDHL